MVDNNYATDTDGEPDVLTKGFDTFIGDSRLEIKEQNDLNKIADGIKSVSQAMKDITDTGLKRDTIVTLIHDKTKISKTNIKKILTELDNFETNHLN